MMRRKQQESAEPKTAKNFINRFESVEDKSPKTNGFAPPKKDLQIPTGAAKLDGNVTQRRLQMDASIDEMTATMERELRLDGAITSGQKQVAQKVEPAPNKTLQQPSQVTKVTNDEKENIIEEARIII